MTEPNFSEADLTLEPDQIRTIKPNTGGYVFARVVSKFYIFTGVCMMLLGMLSAGYAFLEMFEMWMVIVGIGLALIFNGLLCAAAGQFMLAQIDIAMNTREMLRVLLLNQNR